MPCRILQPQKLLLLAAVSLTAITGCEQDLSVRTYSVPVQRQRMLAAIVRQQNQAWFFKLKGPSKEVTAVEKPVRTFLESVKFEKGEPVWKLPEGWKREDGGSRFATLKLPGAQELTVHKLAIPEGMKWEQFQLANVNRWRGELEQGELELVELQDETTSLAMSGTPALFLDVVGVAAPKLKTVEIPFGAGPASGNPADTMPASSAEPVDPASLPIAFTAPPEWKQTPAGAMQLLTFRVTEGEEKVEVSVSAAAGDLLANINRWRGQVKLPRIGAAELAKDVQNVTIDGKPGKAVRMVGAQETIQGAIVDAAGATWFFKLRGDNALAKREQDRFDAFVKSLKFK